MTNLEEVLLVPSYRICQRKPRFSKKLLAIGERIWCNEQRWITVPGVFSTWRDIHMSKVATPFMGPKTSQVTVPHEKIAMRAYEKWCKRGCPDGTHLQD